MVIVVVMDTIDKIMIIEEIIKKLFLVHIIDFK